MSGPTSRSTVFAAEEIIEESVIECPFVFFRDVSRGWWTAKCEKIVMELKSTATGQLIIITHKLLHHFIARQREERFQAQIVALHLCSNALDTFLDIPTCREQLNGIFLYRLHTFMYGTNGLVVVFLVFFNRNQ